MSSKTIFRRAILFIFVIFLGFSTIGARYWYLQIANGRHFQALARQDYLRKLPIPAPRGNIVTSNHVTIATSKPAWSLYYLNQNTPIPHSEVMNLAHDLSVPPKAITQSVQNGLKTLAPYDPIPIARQLSAKQMTTIEENLTSLPNIRIQPVAVRSYPFGSTMGNILGYIGDINQGQYQQLKNKGYSMTSIVGETGIEARYQKYLRGQSGGEFAQVNRQGQLIRLYGQQVPTPGDTLHLTINWRLEQTAQHALSYVLHAMRHAPSGLLSHAPRAQSGGVIAMNPNNGNILAMASDPTYNPNTLVPGNPKRLSYFQKIIQNPWKPFLVRPLSGLYSPGSIFKPIMAVAALASHVITPQSIIYDPGYFPKDPFFKNWYAPGFGAINIEQAIGLSDDVFFYTLGYRMGIQTMDHWMRLFLLNQPSGLGLSSGTSGIIPTPNLLQQIDHVPWTFGWSLNTVIGQGFDQFTLIALARAEAAIANGGTLYKPQIVSSITTARGKLVKKFSPVVLGHLPVSSSSLQVVRAGMALSAQDPNIAKGMSGTGYGALAGFPIPLASKTGTAQRIGKANNAFFITYGPMPHPSLIIIVYVHGGNWGADAGFIARAIYDQYFKVKDPKAKPLFDSVYGRPLAWPFSYTPPKPKAP